jgi:hypothetical protein
MADGSTLAAGIHLCQQSTWPPGTAWSGMGTAVESEHPHSLATLHISGHPTSPHFRCAITLWHAAPPWP